METNKLHFDNVLGISFSIIADRDSAYLENLLERYKLVLENTGKTIGIGANPDDHLKLAILTGFLLCDEIEKMKTEKTRESGEVEQRIKNMTARINEIIPHERHL